MGRLPTYIEARHSVAFTIIIRQAFRLKRVEPKEHQLSLRVNQV